MPAPSSSSGIDNEQQQQHSQEIHSFMNRNDRATYLPIIDLSEPTDSTSHELLQAATQYGFLYLRFRSLPIDAEDLNSLFDVSRGFFTTSPSEKEKYKIGPDDRGWSAPYGETLDENITSEPGDFKEAFNIGEFKNGEPQQALPLDLSTRTGFLDSFQRKSRALCLVLLDHLAAALEIRPADGGTEFFSSRHEQANGSTGSILRLLYYPSQVTSAAHDTKQTEPIRCGAHTDFGSMTLLFQRPGQPGLEIASADGTWLPVEVFPSGTENDAVPPVVVNIGDMLQFWTRGVLRSTKHRVVIPVAGGRSRGNPEDGSKNNDEHALTSRDRYSIAYFCHPAADTLLVGVPSQRVEEQTSKEYQSNIETLTAGEHLRRKLDKAYGWSKQT